MFLKSGWRRGAVYCLAVVFVALIVAAITAAPPALVNRAEVPQLNGDLDQWLAEREQAVESRSPLIEGTQKRIHWFGGRSGSRTRYSIVYLHGFSATRQETAPVAQMVADDLGANLFETRLAGHGLQLTASTGPLVGVRAEDWLDDAAEALAIGQELGEEIIVMGTSTGATLALAMANHPAIADVCCLVLVSPNFATRDSNSELLTWPGGLQLAHLLYGEKRSWTTSNQLQGHYWATSYPMAALVEVMRLVKFVRTLLPMELEQSVLVFYSLDDRVVDPARIEAAFEQIHTTRSELIRLDESGDPSHHVLAGDIMSPVNNELVAETIIRFVQAK